jgi:PleD family two-component response regulator
MRVLQQLNSEVMKMRTARVRPTEEALCPNAAGLQGTRLSLVEDHPAVRRGLHAFLGLQSGLEICGEAEGEHQAVTSIRELNPDLAVVDLSLKEGSGLSLIQRLRQLCPARREPACPRPSSPRHGAGRLSASGDKAR